MLLFIYSFMRKLSVIFTVVFGMIIWFSFATTTELDLTNWTNTDYVAQSSENNNTNDTTSNNDKTTITRTVIPAVPKTGPSGNLIWIILATLVIFGGYIYIKKRADI